MRRKTGQNIECKCCKKVFYVKRVDIKPNGNYCSRKCHYGTITKNCKICGKEMFAKKGSADRKQYCSRSCMGKDRAAALINNRKDFTPWNKGIKTGHTPWNKGKKFVQISGSKNTNWKGGITESNNKIRCSIEYKNWRRSVFERDDYTCTWCGIKGGWNKETRNKVILNADHIIPFATNPDLRLDVNNGRTLCVDCHRKTDTHGVNFKRWNINPSISLTLNYTED